MAVPNEEHLFQKNSAWLDADADAHEDIEKLCTEYKLFLDEAKTEREAVVVASRIAREHGFVPLEELESCAGEKELSGTKVMIPYRKKNLMLVVFGKRPLSEGFSIVASHLDSPRLDLKPNPLVEKEKLALLKTHYYGGIKKYQFASIPMALHGVVYRPDGDTVNLRLGEDAEDPVFTVNDLLIHLSKKVQFDRKTPDVIKGEELNLLFSSIPQKDGEKDSKVKLRTLELLHERYGITEEDLFSAELEAVPAGKARDVGLDMSMVGAYGQDDRICAFASISALIDLEEVPEKTSIVLLVDKEEIGSEGNSSMSSLFFEYALARLISLQEPYSELKKMRACENAGALSADVSAAINPNFPTVLDHDNASRLGYGIGLAKYTGSGGKYDANDCNAEFLSKVRTILNDAGVAWQVSELGKVDEGGGGTIAKYLARYGMEVLDAGPSLLSMHSTFEVSSKIDVWMSKRAYLAFFKEF